MTADAPTAECPATWPGGEDHTHGCHLTIDHRDNHRCTQCGQTIAQCGAEYAPERRDPTARIVRCDRPLGHAGDHEELYTCTTWLTSPLEPMDLTPDERDAAARARTDLRDAPIRHVWAAALRWWATSAGRSPHPETVAARIEAGELTPWTDDQPTNTRTATTAGGPDHDGLTGQPHVSPLDEAAHSVWLHGNWRGLTRMMTTEQREAFADAVDRVMARDNADDPDLNMPPVDRWWCDHAPAAGNRLAGPPSSPAEPPAAPGPHPGTPEQCDTCSGTGWIERPPVEGVPGIGCAHGCPDCEVGRERLARGELLEETDEPGTPEGQGPILGRALRDQYGGLRPLVGEERRFQCGVVTYSYRPRFEAERGPVTEAVLVTPAGARVIEAAVAWRHAGRDDGRSELALCNAIDDFEDAAVDAMQAGQMATLAICATCDGTGRVDRDDSYAPHYHERCPDCAGAGRIPPHRLVDAARLASPASTTPAAEPGDGLELDGGSNAG